VFDDVKIQVDIAVPKGYNKAKKPFEQYGLLFTPSYIAGKDAIRQYVAEHRNLYLTIDYNILTISNSLHKFHKGNNYSDYTYTDFTHTIEELSDFFSTDLKIATIKKIAWGCNIEVEEPSAVYGSWLSLKNSYPLPMSKGNKTYGAKFNFTDYNLKGYNKTEEVKMHNKVTIPAGLLRIETEVKYMKHLQQKGISISTLSDLYKKQNLETLINTITGKYKGIITKPIMNFTNLSPNEMKLLLSMQDKQYREAVAKNHARSYKEDKRRFKALLTNQKNDSNGKIELMLQDKLTHLINT
jgi:hypothetical protein